MEFKDVNEILEYLADNLLTGKNYTRTQVAQVCLPVFLSPFLDKPSVLMDIIKLVEFRVNHDMCADISSTVDLSEVDLTLAKFHVLCGIRGPINLNNFEFEVVKQIDNATVQDFAKHKDFPLHLKTEFYNRTGEVEYLPQDAQDIFVF